MYLLMWSYYLYITYHAKNLYDYIHVSTKYVIPEKRSHVIVNSRHGLYAFKLHVMFD